MPKLNAGFLNESNPKIFDALNNTASPKSNGLRRTRVA